MANRGIFVLGVDPGLANMGWSVVELHSHTEVLHECGVQRTEPSGKKRKVLASDDNLRRAREMAAELARLFDVYSISAICAESMSFPRNSSAAAKMAMCWGAVASFAHLHNLSVIQSSPQELKKVVCGSKSASKEDVGQAVRIRFADVDKLLTLVPPGRREHAYDATAAIMAALVNSDVIRALRRVAV